MNIKLIKAEIEKLSLMLSAWEQGEQVSAIERDIVLDKLKNIYDAVRFDTATEEVVPATPATPIPPVAPAPVVEENDEESDEKEVEVELIFADDEFPEEDLVDDEEEEEEPVSVSDFITATVASAIADAAEAKTAEDVEPEVEVEVIYDEESEEATKEPAEESSEPTPEPIPAIEPIVVDEEASVEPVAEPIVIEQKPAIEEIAPAEPAQVATPVQEPTLVETPAPVETPHPKGQMNSLFNMDEVRRQPRSKHQRMMSIYNNSEPKQEKVVDISKIFNMEIDEPAEVAPVEVKPVAKPAVEPIAKPVAEPVAKPKPVEITVAKPIVEEKPQTLADAIPAPQTLADIITAPTALAEEINNARVRSLRDGIGLNDKFLMIRDLFDGDGEAYEEAINALDELETLDDCMIHIIENYAWNPDSEGSKFIMQLLERKLS